MLRSRTSASTLLLGVLSFGAALLGSAVGATAGDYGEGRIVNAADRCAAVGLGFIDLGHGTCGRVHVRVDETRSAASDSWTGGTTSNATLRSDSSNPGTTIPGHLRVRGGLESYSPFR